MSIVKWTGLGDTDEFHDPDNWDLGTPTDGDDVYITLPDYNIFRSTFSGGWVETYNSFNVSLSNTTLGTDAEPILIKATYINIGYPTGSSNSVGSQRIHLDVGDEASTITIFGSNSSAETNGFQPIRIKCDNAATVFYIRSGSVGIADQPGESATFSAVHVLGTFARVVVGHVAGEASITQTSATILDGSLVLYSGGTTLNIEGGVVRTEGVGEAWTTMNLKGGILVSNATGAITTINSYDSSLIDFTKSNISRTVTNLNMHSGSRVKIDRNIITLTNDVVISTDDAVEVQINKM